MRDKAIIEEKMQRLVEMTNGFCDVYLDSDYKHLCEKLIHKMSRKRHVPFLSGRIEIWAAAVVYAIGSINFLFDRSFEIYTSSDDICDYFGTSKSTTSQKAKVIRDMFKMGYWDKEFSTIRIMERKPFPNIMNGLIVDVLQRQIQEIKHRHDDRKE
jgi:hypothetical protein